MKICSSTPSKRQVGKLEERLQAVARKSGLDSRQFQIALAYPGTELEDEMVSLLVRFSKKASGIITPVRAQDTGLIAGGWSVESDNPEGGISLANLDYSTGPVQEKDGGYVDGDTMLARAGNAYGSLGFAAALLKAQEEGKEIFPVESRGRHYFIMPRTVLLHDYRHRRVACFDWDGQQWVLAFGWLSDDFHDDVRFVRPRELPSVA